MDILVQTAFWFCFSAGIFINYMLVKRESAKVAKAAQEAANMIRSTAEEVSRKLEEKAAIKSQKLEEKAARVSDELEEKANVNGA